MNSEQLEKLEKIIRNLEKIIRGLKEGEKNPRYLKI